MHLHILSFSDFDPFSSNTSAYQSHCLSQHQCLIQTNVPLLGPLSALVDFVFFWTLYDSQGQKH